MNENTYIKPFIKWVGGKTTLIEDIFKLFPKEITSYYEPFVGGGSVFLHLIKQIEEKKIIVKNSIIVSDTNTDLINIYTYIQNDVNTLIKEIKILSDNYHKSIYIENVEKRKKYSFTGKETIEDIINGGKANLYYYYRNQFNIEKDPLKRCALFLFLNKTCFRGLNRFSKGKFNTPFGNYKNPTIYDENQLKYLSKMFKKHKIKFKNIGFIYACKYIRKNSLVYFDPPYYKIKNTSFTSYTKEGFDKHEHLVKLCDKLNEKGISFIHSNSYCDYNLQNYKQYKIQSLMCKRRINSKKPNDQAKEVLITNL